MSFAYLADVAFLLHSVKSEYEMCLDPIMRCECFNDGKTCAARSLLAISKRQISQKKNKRLALCKVPVLS